MGGEGAEFFLYHLLLSGTFENDCPLGKKPGWHVNRVPV